MNHRLPPLNALKAFEAAARHMSFSHAAAELNVTPGAISRQVQTLEDWLGDRLFVRRHRQVQLTPLGRSYLEAVSSPLERIGEATERALAGRVGRPLAICSYPPLPCAGWCRAGAASTTAIPTSTSSSPRR